MRQPHRLLCRHCGSRVHADMSGFPRLDVFSTGEALVDADTGVACTDSSKLGGLAMTLLFVVAVVLLSVRIAAVLVWLMQRHEDRVLFGPQERKVTSDRQLMTLRVPAQDYLTKDDVSVRVDAVVCFRIVDPGDAPTDAQNYHVAMSQLAQASLRSVIGRTERDDLSSSRDQFTAESGPIMEAAQRGPQDAPRWGPHDADGNPQDAVAGGPQRGARVDWTIAQVNGSADALATSREPKRAVPDAKADEGLAIGSSVRRGTTKGVRDFAAGRRMSLVRLGRDESSPVPVGDPQRERAAASGKAIIDSVPRPVGGPSCLGGRGDAGYLRGWDDAVDWVGKGNQAQPPTWGDVAYMTGWNDASRAMAKAGLAGETSAVVGTASSTT